ncbi:response regulator transcription factor, partial [Micromonospora azadirachtae]
TPALRAGTPTLTDREWEVARLAAHGATSKAVAEKLYLSTRTVENHLQRVYAKLGVTSRAELHAALRAIPGHEGGDAD